MQGGLQHIKLQIHLKEELPNKESLQASFSNRVAYRYIFPKFMDRCAEATAAMVEEDQETSEASLRTWHLPSGAGSTGRQDARVRNHLNQASLSQGARNLLK